MGTRSIIGKLNKIGTVTAIYCHWDGYPEHNGRILREHYSTNERVGKLINLGNLSSLGAELGRRHNFDSRDAKYDGWCRAYGRDRREKDQEAVTYMSVEEFHNADWGQDYTYLWDGKKWLCWAEMGNRPPVDLYEKEAA